MISNHIPNFSYDLLLLLIRVVLAVSFLVASRNKQRNIKKFAKENGLPVPGAKLVALAEFAAGLSVLFGMAPQFGAAVMALLMLGTIRLHIFKWKTLYWAAKGGWEYDLMLLTFAGTILLFGGGHYSLLAARI